MTDRILGIIGMMRKASALVVGEDQVLEAVQKGKVKVLIIPSDAGEATSAAFLPFFSGFVILTLSR